MLAQLIYNLRDTFRSIARHKSLTFLSVFTIAITLFLLGSVMIITLNGQLASKQVEDDLEIVAFCTLDVDEEGLNHLKTELSKLPNVKSVDYVSKDSALDNLNARFEKDTDLRTSLEGQNPLPDSFRIKVSAAEHIQETVTRIESFEHIESVRYGQSIVENVVQLSQSVRIFGIVVIAAMVVATLFLINNTISLTVANRQKEIEVMRYLGATNSYISMPFFFEGILVGIVGALVAIFSLYFGYGKLQLYIASTLPFLPVMRDPQLISFVMMILVTIGLFLGAIGSALATGRYLKN